MNFNQTSHTNTHRHTDWMCWWIHQQVREIRHVCAYQQADALNSSKTEKNTTNLNEVLKWFENSKNLSLQKITCKLCYRTIEYAKRNTLCAYIVQCAVFEEDAKTNAPVRQDLNRKTLSAIS